MSKYKICFDNSAAMRGYEEVQSTIVNVKNLEELFIEIVKIIEEDVIEDANDEGFQKTEDIIKFVCDINDIDNNLDIIDKIVSYLNSVDIGGWPWVYHNEYQ